MSAMTNGHAPAHVNDFEAADQRLTAVLDTEVEDLQSLLEEEITARGEMESLLVRSKDREARLRKAISVLSGTPLTSMTPQSAVAKAKAKAKAPGAWSPSDATLTRVRTAFHARYAELGEPMTLTSLGKWMGEHGEGIGGETIRKTMDVLRVNQEVRVAGTTRGGGKLWAPMPTGDDGR